MENLIAANIRSRPTRTFISILAVALGVVLMLVVGGIVSGTLNDYLGRTVAVGADYILQPAGSSVLYAFSDASLNSKLADTLQQVPGIEAVTPVLSKFSAAHFGLVFGIDMDSYNKFPGRLQMVSGRASLKGDEAIVDQILAEAKKLKPGMTLNILDHDFTITGICRSGAVVRVFLPLETLQKLLGTTDRVTVLFAKAAPNATAGRCVSKPAQTVPALLSPPGFGSEPASGGNATAGIEGIPDYGDSDFHVVEFYGDPAGDVHDYIRAHAGNWDSKIFGRVSEFYSWHDSKRICYDMRLGRDSGNMHQRNYSQSGYCHVPDFAGIHDIQGPDWAAWF